MGDYKDIGWCVKNKVLNYRLEDLIYFFYLCKKSHACIINYHGDDQRACISHVLEAYILPRGL